MGRRGTTDDSKNARKETRTHEIKQARNLGSKPERGERVLPPTLQPIARRIFVCTRVEHLLFHIYIYTHINAYAYRECEVSLIG